ncbi:uncharacterized protein BJ212DRAFT_1477887 [Suillus subaureus]|uniref:Uncharacterized protein n=1 Tax=Suillus subaureus TaxID=48587 RepID=A0A9P7EHQ8_9AGAM|nr:uncharacterized protein BJ212DRAFT_1477887 [Suillus subaureus]KAG1822057.1 hypothetical protein BJ212DRAFT_1477887 [Suillus subaureus]
MSQVIAGSHQAVIEPSQPTPKTPVQAPPAIDAGDILIPRLNNPCQACSKLDWPCATQLDKRTRNPSLLSLSSAVPAAALNVPMPDLHTMAIVIWDGAAQITILDAHVAEQDGAKLSTSTPHSQYATLLPMQHPYCFINLSMSPPESALPPLTDLLVAGMVCTPPKFKDASAIDGLLFEYNQVVHPEDPDMSGEIVDPGDLSNLVPEYDSSDDTDVEVDVEVKVEASSEEVDMAT